MKSLLRTEHKNTEPFFRFGGGKVVVFYFYPGKDTELLTHSFLRFASRIYYTLFVFFFPEEVESGKKIPLFSLTHTFFEIFILKVSFPGK